jgi:predicted nucleic acid-binding protein
MIRSIDRIYLDTNVILDVIENRRTASLTLLRKVRELGFYCCTSSFALCETIDKEQEFMHIGNMCKNKCTFDDLLRNKRNKELNTKERQIAIDRVGNFFATYPVVIFNIEGDTWDKAIEALQILNVSASDSVQIATAIANKCSVFITNDEKLLNEAKKIKGLKPLRAQDVSF